MTPVRLRNPSGQKDEVSQKAVNNVLLEQYPPAVVSFETPIPPSVNHAYVTTSQGRRVLSRESKRWIEQAQLIAKVAMKKHGWCSSTDGKLVMELYAYWPDNRRRDIHNLHKVIADAFEGVLYIDDRMLLIRDMDFTVDKRQPRVEIVLREFWAGDGE